MNAQLETSPTEVPARVGTVVRLAHVAKRIDERPVLKDVTLDIAAGESLTILGANGAGKSTLLRLIASLTPVSSGEIELFGQPQRCNVAAWRRRMGFIGHQSMLYRDLTAAENLAFFAKLYGVPDAQERTRQMLIMVGLVDRANDPPKAFSRGMQQRLSIARALIHDPDLLLADEPFAGLDARSSEGLEKLFTKLSSHGKTLLIVNHDIAQSVRLCRRCVILRNGTVVSDRPTVGLDPQAVRAEVEGL
jgi:heme ABC exporter ATP-binding subunit CcmA